MENKKRIIIISAIIIFIVLFTILIIKNNKVVFYLNGENNIIIKYGEEFIDPGFVAKTGLGKDISDKVIVSGEVNTSVSGVYTVIYELDYHGNYVLGRKVIVQNITGDDLEIRLNGNDEVYLLKDNLYIEEGADVFNKVDNSILENSYINITNNIDESVPGKYIVNYSFNYGSQIISNTRSVIVFDIDYLITPEELTTKDVEIDLNLKNIDNYLNIKLPDNTTTSKRNVYYDVDSNGEYEFIITLTNNQVFRKTIIVDNIIDNYTCNGEITSTGTKITVTPSSSNITEYKWILDNETVNGSSTYTKNKLINSAQVNLKFNNGKEYKINCKVDDRLVYHFKYDVNNTKPFMKNNTYTSVDKLRLDSMLKQVVSEAGFGTRAGVVAAARFLVGALDYKVPYEGGKYYNRIGLNIGQTGAWGSSGSGLDCYSFVAWARSQNGLPDDSFYSGKKYNTYDEVSRIRVGDYLLTPCTSSVCKNQFNINHIALVIGIDNNYIYVAESTTGNINALVVTRLDKKNLPKKNNLSLVKHVTYKSDGNVTDMWM